MITKTLQYIGIGLYLLLSVTGCSDVVSKHIVGNEPSVLHPEEWDGIWISEENALISRVRDPEQGIIQIAWIDDENDGFQMHTLTCKILKGNEWQFWNVIATDNEPVDEYYSWGRIEKDKMEIVLWIPDVEAFKEAVEKQKIQGEIEKYESDDFFFKISTEKVKLHDTSHKIVEFLETNTRDSYFFQEEALLLRKLGK